MKSNIFLVLSLTAFVSCTPARMPAGRATASANPSSLLDLVNQARTKGCRCGSTYMPPVPKLKWNSKLAAAAKNQSDYMNRVKRMGHSGNRGSNPGTRISATGYRWSFYAENVAAGQSNTAEVMRSWLKSPGHCRNIMNRNATEMGAARSGIYWTEVFAAPY
jgi:uncharacterized protein YkwD